MTMDITLDTGHPPDPAYTAWVAEALAEAVRVLNHQTTDHAALASPADVHTVVWELKSLASRLPHLLAQLAGWLEREQAAGGIMVTGGEWRGNPAQAVTVARLRLDMASGAAEVLKQELANVATLTTDLAGTDIGGSGDG